MVGVLASIALALGPHTAHPCMAAQPRGPSVPAPLGLHTTCGWYEHDRNGRTFRLPNHWGAKHGIGTGRRYGARLDVCFHHTGHIPLCVHGKLVWRSRGAYGGFSGDLAFGPREFAFADYYKGVYLTDLRRPERLVLRGRGLYPDDFTRNGDLIVVAHHALVVVSRAGKIVGRHPFRSSNGFAFDWRSDTYVFVTPRGRLATLRERRVRLGPVVAKLGGVGVIAKGVIAFAGRGVLTLMREDGSTVASSRWDARRETLVAGPSASLDMRTFGYELVRARPRPPGRAVPRGPATLYVLHPGGRRARVLLQRWRSPVECVEGGPCAGGLDWNGRFFLYQPGDGHVGVVDSATGRVIELTRFDRSLPHLGTQPEQAVIAWKREFPR